MSFGAVSDDDFETLDHEIRVYRDGAWAYCGMSAGGPPANSELAQTQGPGVYQLAPIDPLTRRPIPGKLTTRTILAPRSAEPTVAAPASPVVMDLTSQLMLQQAQEQAEARRQLDRDIARAREDATARWEAQQAAERAERAAERQREREDRQAQRELMMQLFSQVPTLLMNGLQTFRQVAAPPPAPASGADVALELLRAELERERKRDPMLDVMRVKMMRDMMRDMADEKDDKGDDDGSVWGEALREAVPVLAQRFGGGSAAAQPAPSPLADPQQLAAAIMAVGPERAIETLRALAADHPELGSTIAEAVQPTGTHRLRAAK